MMEAGDYFRMALCQLEEYAEHLGQEGAERAFRTHKATEVYESLLKGGADDFAAAREAVSAFFWCIN